VITTRFPRYAKCLQLERRMVFEGVDVGRIHKPQSLDRTVFGFWCSGRKESPVEEP